MLEEFGILSPCDKCDAQKPCEAKESECFELRAYMDLVRKEYNKNDKREREG